MVAVVVAIAIAVPVSIPVSISFVVAASVLAFISHWVTLEIVGVGMDRADIVLIRVAWLGFTTTYKTAGTAKLSGSHIRRRFLWVGLWKKLRIPNQPLELIS